jgi:hypothetical protein
LKELEKEDSETQGDATRCQAFFEQGLVMLLKCEDRHQWNNNSVKNAHAARPDVARPPVKLDARPEPAAKQVCRQADHHEQRQQQHDDNSDRHGFSVRENLSA